MTSTSIKNIFLQIPAGVRSFLIKAIAVFIGWQLLYRLLLTRINQPDFFLTNSTAWGTSSVLKMFYRNVDMIPDNFKAIILINGQKVIGIANPCNALEIFVLYFAFLYCDPAPNKNKWRFAFVGIPAIYLANIIRCTIITWLNISHRGWVDISHHYIFTTLVYLLFFSLWIKFTKSVSNS